MTPRAARARALAVALAACVAAGQAAPAARIVSLDQCADQYVLALAPRSEIAGVSWRATQGDSALRDRAVGLPRVRADLETVLAARPSLVVRTWGGDASLLEALHRRGVPVLSIADPVSFGEARENLIRAARVLGHPAEGERLAGELDRDLAAARGAGRGAAALYLTLAGETAGSGTQIDAILAAAGFRNAERLAGYRAATLEALELHPPSLVVTGFFDEPASAQAWAQGRHAALRRLIARRPVAALPSTDLACPSWIAGRAALRLARWARGY